MDASDFEFFKARGNLFRWHSPLRNQGGHRPPRSLIGMSFRQGIPWRVALQQSPPPLPLPISFCHRKSRSPNSFQRMVTVDQQPVSKKGAVHSSEFNKLSYVLSASVAGLNYTSPTFANHNRIYIKG